MPMENLSTTARMLLDLYKMVKSQHLDNIDGISDNMWAPFVVIDCKIAMEKERLTNSPGLSQTLDIADAGNAKLAKSNLTQALTTQSGDARRQVGDFEEKRNKLLETLRNFIGTELNKSTDQLIQMIASNPTAMFGSSPIQNELIKQQQKLQEFHVAVDNIKRDESDLVTTIERVYTAYCKLSGERALPIDRLMDVHSAPQQSR